jgi:3'(2'), 5'-bisphosphate nucleotidase
MASVESDVQFARALATEIGDALLAVRDDLFARYEGQEIKDRGDALAQAIIVRQMQARRPLDAVLSEDAVDDFARVDC